MIIIEHIKKIFAQKISSDVEIFQVVAFFVCSLLSAAIYFINIYLFAAISALTLFYFFEKPLNYILIALFVFTITIAPYFFIAADVEDDKNGLIVHSPSAKVEITDADNLTAYKDIEVGDFIFGSFEKDKKKKYFSKAAYSIKMADVETFRVPFISSILKYRINKSYELYELSNGRVRVAQALIFADKRFIREGLRDEYIISGLSHFLAMSGLHTAIIITIIMALLFFLPLKLKMIFAVPAVVAVSIMGAFSVTVVRASIFAIIFMVAFIVDAKIDSKKFLVALAGIFFILSPRSMFDISFLLSFSAVFGIIYFAGEYKNKLLGALLTGVAATLITAPISMYVFATANHLSIISTVIMTPIVYLHIISAIFAIIAPEFMREFALFILQNIEALSAWLIHKIAEYSYFAFIIKSIPFWAMAGCIIFIVAALLSRYKWISLLGLLIIFYPAEQKPYIIFPKLSDNARAFIIFDDNKSQIYYQGTIQNFKYEMLPIIAKYGIKTFDYGRIRTFRGNNLFIKIKEDGVNFDNVAINEADHAKRFAFFTRSNEITSENFQDNVTYIAFKNKFRRDSIYSLAEKGSIVIKKKDEEIEYENKSE